MSTWRIGLLAMIVVSIIASIVYLVATYEVIDTKPELKSLSGTIAEGMVYQSRREPFPRASCDACRVGKLKLGIFSLGAFNTVEFDNLVVNLPTNREIVSLNDDESTNNVANASIEAFELKPLMSSLNTSAILKKFVGIRINGFELNRMRTNKLERICKARLVKNSDKKLMMYDVELSTEFGIKVLSTAEIKFKPSFGIAWSNGFIKLDISQVLP